MGDGFGAVLGDGFGVTLADGFGVALADGFSVTLADGLGIALTEGFGAALSDGFADALTDGFGVCMKGIPCECPDGLLLASPPDGDGLGVDCAVALGPGLFVPPVSVSQPEKRSRHAAIRTTTVFFK